MTDDPDDEKAARLRNLEARALNFLARRDHARQELRRKLLRSGEEDEVDEILDRVGRWINDEAFAEHQSEILVKRGWGPNAIRQKLRQRGISEEDIELAISKLEKNYDFRQQAQKRLERKFPDFDPTDEKARAKAFRHLVRRGFSQNHARSVALDTSR